MSIRRCHNCEGQFDTDFIEGVSRGGCWYCSIDCADDSLAPQDTLPTLASLSPSTFLERAMVSTRYTGIKVYTPNWTN